VNGPIETSEIDGVGIERFMLELVRLFQPRA